MSKLGSGEPAYGSGQWSGILTYSIAVTISLLPVISGGLIFISLRKSLRKFLRENGAVLALNRKPGYREADRNLLVSQPGLTCPTSWCERLVRKVSTSLE